MNSLDEGVWRCRYLCKRMKVRVFSSLVLPVSLYSCGIGTLAGELRLDSFGLCRFADILGYHGMNILIKKTRHFLNRLILGQT